MKEIGLEYSTQSKSQMKGPVERLCFISSKTNKKFCVTEYEESEEEQEMMMEN